MTASPQRMRIRVVALKKFMMRYYFLSFHSQIPQCKLSKDFLNQEFLVFFCSPEMQFTFYYGLVGYLTPLWSKKLNSGWRFSLNRKWFSSRWVLNDTQNFDRSAYWKTKFFPLFLIIRLSSLNFAKKHWEHNCFMSTFMAGKNGDFLCLLFELGPTGFIIEVISAIFWNDSDPNFRAYFDPYFGPFLIKNVQ